MMGVLTRPGRDLDVFDATFVHPDLSAFCRLDELGLEVWVSGSNPIVRSCPVGSSRASSTDGAAVADAWRNAARHGD